MTSQHAILNDDNFLPVLDHGFVGLIDVFGNDAAIVQAARVSYGTGTKSVREDRGLIRYLMRHQHTSPFEQCEVKLLLKLPIFVMRQLVRHRTANLNEYSGRFSVMSDEFYLPTADQIKVQSPDNKQGRADEVDAISKHGVQWLMQTAYEQAYTCYKILLGEREGAEEHYDAYSDEEPLLGNDFPGIARELARAVLPVANYTETYFKMDLLNLFKMLKLRCDSHAQYEIRVYADAICTLVRPKFPMAFEAFDDYLREAVTLSRMETNLVRDLIHGESLQQTIETHGGLSALAEHYGLTKREMTDFVAHFSRQI